MESVFPPTAPPIRGVLTAQLRHLCGALSCPDLDPTASVTALPQSVTSCRPPGRGPGPGGVLTPQPGHAAFCSSLPCLLSPEFWFFHKKGKIQRHPELKYYLLCFQGALPDTTAHKNGHWVLAPRSSAHTSTEAWACWHVCLVHALHSSTK